MTSLTDRSLDEALLQPEFLANPYPVYQRLRTEAPVYWCEPWKSWIISRYVDVVAVHRDDGFRFSSANRSKASLELISDAALEGMGLLADTTGLFQSDPPQYFRLRRIVTNTFKSRLANINQRVTEIVNRMLDAVQGIGQMDVIRDLAYPLPAIIVAELLGVPPEDRNQFKQWSTGFVDLMANGRADLDSALEAERSLRAAREWFRGVTEERRIHPQDDMISDLVTTQVQGDEISEGDLFSTCFGFLVAGHETTTNLIGNGLLALLKNPDQLRQLKEEPKLITCAVEELLRYDAPLQRNVRIAKEEVQIGGTRIGKGQFVFTMLGSANRDPEQFPNPDRLDIRRQPNRHLAFGFGMHHCMGTPLARIEGAIALSTLLHRLPKLRLASNKLEWQENIAFHGLKSLPVVFD